MIKAKIDFWLDEVFYEKGDEVEGIETKELLNYLNEKGFIEPLTIKQIQNFKKPEKEKKEE